MLYITYVDLVPSFKYAQVLCQQYCGRKKRQHPGFTYTGLQDFYAANWPRTYVVRYVPELDFRWMIHEHGHILSCGLDKSEDTPKFEYGNNAL
jgi:hypothetical protein